MSALVDQNEKPIQTGQNGQNGQSAQATMDVRIVPTGTLIYNLIRFTSDEIGLENMVHQMEYAKQQQKMVADPPPLERAKERLAMIQEARYIAAREINERFATVDKDRMDKLGMSVVTPDTAPAPADPPVASEDKTS